GRPTAARRGPDGAWVRRCRRWSGAGPRPTHTLAGEPPPARPEAAPRPARRRRRALDLGRAVSRHGVGGGWDDRGVVDVERPTVATPSHEPHPAARSDRTTGRGAPADVARRRTRRGVAAHAGAPEG